MPNAFSVAISAALNLLWTGRGSSHSVRSFKSAPDMEYAISAAGRWKRWKSSKGWSLKNSAQA